MNDSFTHKLTVDALQTYKFKMEWHVHGAN